jgi:hypothetical protein
MSYEPRLDDDFALGKYDDEDEEDEDMGEPDRMWCDD